MNHTEIYQLLKYQRQELTERLSMIRQDFNQDNSLAQDDALFKIAHNTKTELAKVKRAIDNIEKDSYGICENCGQRIEAELLSENPLEVLCANCLNHL